MTGRIDQQGLRDWLSRIVAAQTVIAPTQVEGSYLFRPVASVAEIAFDYTQSTVPPKEWLFPRTETLFTIDRQDATPKLLPPTPPEPRVLFGIRPCDARALAILDLPFLAQPADRLYQARRERTTLVGLACREPQQGECFCTSLGGGPQDATYLDVLLAETDDGYAVEVLTEKGQALMADAPLREGGALPPAPAVDDSVPAASAGERIRREFGADYWRRLADRCLGCKMCSYLCPTCHCFDVRDCQVDGRMERVRSWDGCQSALFTRLAGGHNPRGAKEARLRQFYAHKYVYFPERFGVTQCVGCGRCAHFCPVNIDIRETLRDLAGLEV